LLKEQLRVNAFQLNRAFFQIGQDLVPLFIAQGTEGFLKLFLAVAGGSGLLVAGQSFYLRSSR